MKHFIHLDQIRQASAGFLNAQPFSHCVIEHFFDMGFARRLARECPDYDDNTAWLTYDNPIEVKKACNDWNRFLPLTYQLFHTLNSPEFVDFLSKVFCIQPLYPDYGLNGGGWHIHRSGGKLNTHLDYSVHPKLKLQRKLNLLVYLNEAWQPEWGGALGLWAHDATTNQPGTLVKEIMPLFNRAVLFDTTQHSWHGLPKAIHCPKGQYRQSIAAYYLTLPPSGLSDQREKALFVPYEDQKDDPEVLALIRKRANAQTATEVYRKER